MGAFRLHRFTNPSTLRAIRPPLLVQLLTKTSKSAEYFDSRGLDLPDGNGAGINYDKLVVILMDPQPGMPDGLVDDLYFVHEMATDEGMDALLAAIDGLPPGQDPGLDPTPDPTPADLAVEVRLKAPNLLEEVHAAQQINLMRRSFVYYAPRDADADTEFSEPSPEVQKRITEQINNALEKQRRGRTAQLFFFVKDDGVWILVRHGRPCVREEAVEGGDKTGTVFYRPLTYDVMKYEPLTGELALFAETKTLGKAYLISLGTNIFADPEFWKNADKYTLAPLVNLGTGCLACDDIDGMESVRLAELQIMRGGPQKVTDIKKAHGDLLADYEAHQTPLPRLNSLRRAVFAIKFTGSPSERRLSISPSEDKAGYTHDDDAAVAEVWLKKRGFLKGTDVPNDAVGQPVADA